MLRDVEVQNPDPVIKARQFHVSHSAAGRNKFPFRKMLIGDYFVMETLTEARQARCALQSFYKRIPGRRFMVRQKDDGVWYCRRYK